MLLSCFHRVLFPPPESVPKNKQADENKCCSGRCAPCGSPDPKKPGVLESPWRAASSSMGLTTDEFPKVPGRTGGRLPPTPGCVPVPRVRACRPYPAHCREPEPQDLKTRMEHQGWRARTASSLPLSHPPLLPPTPDPRGAAEPVPAPLAVLWSSGMPAGSGSERI